MAEYHSSGWFKMLMIEALEEACPARYPEKRAIVRLRGH
jgi:hypothetical protein